MYVYIHNLNYLTGIQAFYKDFDREDIPHYFLKVMEKLIPRDTSQQLLPMVAIACFFINF